jgi:hypothetical protein
MDPATIATFITGSGLSHLYTTFTPLAALALSLMPWTCSRGRTTQWSNHVPVCFSSRFQLCGFAQRPWADQFCEFGCGTRLVKKDISVSEEGKPNKFATVHQLETYTAPLGIHIPQSGKNNLSVEVSGRRHIALAFWLTFEQWKGIKFTDVFGYIYTSGTTGLPKAPRSGVLTTSKVSILSIF